MYAFAKSSLNTLIILTASVLSVWGGHPSRGLWVGEVALNAVNEATGAVGDSNTFEFSDPAIPTATSDTAYLRLILHVNGAGQVSLLKSVAVVEGTTSSDGGSDIVLLTDPSLYPNYPGIAKRLASAFYDFGDARAVAAVENLIDTATTTAVEEALNGSPESVIETAVGEALNPIVDQADVDAAYLDSGMGASSFLTDDFFSLEQVQAIADEVARLIDDGTKLSSDFNDDPGVGSYNPFPSDPLGGNFSAAVTAAEELHDRSFFGDTRGIDAIMRIVVAAARAVDDVEAGAELATKQAEARKAAETAWHNAADLGQAFNQFLAYQVFTDLPAVLLDPAVQAALDAEADGGDEAQIREAVKEVLFAELSVHNAVAQAEAIRSESLWQDSRARSVIDDLIDSAANAAARQVLIDTDQSLLTDAVAQALDKSFNAVEPGPVFATAPSKGYSTFVTGVDYESASDTAAQTAASEAYFLYNAGVSDPADLTLLIRRAVSKALIGPRNQVASLPMNSIPLSGSLSAGETLEGEIFLPALAPTNPFMHRLHPDHAEGFAITRKIFIMVDPPPDGSGFALAGYGVSRLSGTYREEIFGLHKPLGSNQDIGLTTQGSYTLNRITLVDTLNF